MSPRIQGSTTTGTRYPRRKRRVDVSSCRTEDARQWLTERQVAPASAGNLPSSTNRAGVAGQCHRGACAAPGLPCGDLLDDLDQLDVVVPDRVWREEGRIELPAVERR